MWNFTPHGTKLNFEFTPVTLLRSGQNRQIWRYPKAGVWCKSGLHHLRGVSKTVIPLHGVRQIDIIKGVFVLSTPVIYRSVTKIVRSRLERLNSKKVMLSQVAHISKSGTRIFT